VVQKTWPCDNGQRANDQRVRLALFTPALLIFTRPRNPSPPPRQKARALNPETCSAAVACRGCSAFSTYMDIKDMRHDDAVLVCRGAG